MNMITQKQAQQRKRRVRAKIFGTAERPRLSVRITNRHIVAQLVDDTQGKTLAYVTTAGAKTTGSLTAKAAWSGAEIAKQAKKHKINRVVLDRGSKSYQNRLHALAQAARENGLEF